MSTKKTEKTKEQKAASAVAIIFITLMLSNAIAMSVMEWQASISNTSEVKTSSPLIALSGDKIDSPQLKSIDWGKVYPDSYAERAVCVYNDHPQDTFELYLTTANWSPSEASKYIAVTWDLKNAYLASRNITKATIRLTVAEDITGITNFSFDIIITGIES